MQQKFCSDSNDEVNIIVSWFVGVGSIDLGSDSSDEMKITTIGIVEDGPIDLGSDSRNMMNIVVGVVPKMRRAPKTTWLQELEDINKIFQEDNAQMRRLNEK